MFVNTSLSSYEQPVRIPYLWRIGEWGELKLSEFGLHEKVDSYTFCCRHSCYSGNSTSVRKKAPLKQGSFPLSRGDRRTSWIWSGEKSTSRLREGGEKKSSHTKMESRLRSLLKEVKTSPLVRFVYRCSDCWERSATCRLVYPSYSALKSNCTIPMLMKRY